MKHHPTWHGVRMRKAMEGSDPDAPPRALILPAIWDARAGEALAALAPGRGAVHLAAAAAAWITPIARRGAELDVAPGLEERGLEERGLETGLHALLRARRGAPAAALWAGRAADDPSFVLNLAAFHAPETGFDIPAFLDAIALAVTALSLAAPGAVRVRVGFADLDALIAALGLAYDSESARAVGAGLAALLRLGAEATSARLAGSLGSSRALATPLPTALPEADAFLPGFAAAALALQAARSEGTPLRHVSTTAIGLPGAAEALLGVATGGFAPAFAPIDAAGHLTAATLAFLAARAMTPEAALAAELAGNRALPIVGAAAHRAMHDAIAPWIEALPARPQAETRISPSPFRPLPTRCRGYAQRASVGGHTIFLRTGEYADGGLGEIAIALTKEGAAFRGLMDQFALAVSIGLQHGTPLAVFAEAFANTSFGPAGAVEGDPQIGQASSLPDYVFRHLAAHYLGRVLPPSAGEEPEERSARAGMPLLPLDLPEASSPRARRRRLRVVA